jgi:RNA polymerase-binding transcription factor DksA
MSRIRFPLRVLKPIKDHLTQEEKKLLKRKEALAQEDPYANEDRVNDNAAIDSDAAEEAGHERIAALRKEIDRALIGIRKSLTRIKIGKYGLCEVCGQLIDTDRLAVNPTASRCMRCTQK